MSETVFIAGAGQMGQGIAQVIACAGLKVTLFDVTQSALQAALERVKWSVEKLHVKGRITEIPEVITSRITLTTTLDSAQGSDLVIEAAPEKESLKRELFSQLDQIIPQHVPFTSNTSAIPISALASATSRPERFCGLHFFNPVPMMSLVEVVRGSKTSDETIAQVMQFAEQIGKQPVLVQGDQAGFIVNRILGAAMMEAIRILEAGQASAVDIDKAMRLGCGWKMGPLETADLAGLDVVMHMCDIMQVGNTDQVFAPPATLRELVNSGHLGRKTGNGFYSHSSE
ncbi:3-hydroxyacyl-CoA dehydrogenase family protein [Planctomicrobium sp. SH661]|uniref:3-hydroxyacyl-CoA dehydrogenase family protein n=1 Tax=Planctomicrobium sp. SH661 TaxID=3448124 RepID=UPI003F5BAA17